MSFPSKLLLTGVLVIGLLLVIEGRRMREMERMISYMEEKYGEAFSPVQPFGGQLGKNLDALELKSEKFKVNVIVSFSLGGSRPDKRHFRYRLPSQGRGRGAFAGRRIMQHL